MGLSIKNDDVETMLRDLAALRGVSLTEALRQALVAELAREAKLQEERRAAKRAKLQSILAEAARIPRLNDMSDDEIIGYDAVGLPR
jgi:antitoxin VapB